MTGSLVIEQIEAGAELIREFDKYASLRTAFWLKESGDGDWYLHLVSDRIDDSNFDLAFAEVLRLTRSQPTPWLDPYQVKVAGIDDPVAKDVLGLQPKASGKFATRLRHLRLGNVTADEIYIYPLPVSIP